jgi:hypothetical protein
VAVSLSVFATGWPSVGTGSSALDGYTFYATAGAICLMVAYLMVEVAAAYFVLAPRFRVITAGDNQLLGVGVPLVGSLAIVVILFFNLQGQGLAVSPPVMAGMWMAIGLAVALGAGKLTTSIGQHLAEEIELADEVTAVRQVEPQGAQR